MHVYLKAKQLIQRLVDAGHVSYFAGGWVRDYLLGHPSDDIDIATSAGPEEVQAIFEKTVPVGVSFGVILVVVEGHAFEVASFRKDGLYVDGRKPVIVDWASAKEDASRRDFTINGMFFDPLDGKVIDYIGGQEDLSRGVIRSIGSANKRFSEDRLRIIRAVRFATRFGFYIDGEIERAIPQFSQRLFPCIAKERLWAELKKMRPLARGLLLLHRYGLFQEIFSILPHVDEEELREKVQAFDRFPLETPTEIYIAMIFQETKLQQMEAFMDCLKLSGQEKVHVKRLYMARDVMASGSLADRVRLYALPEIPLLLTVLGVSYVSEYKHYLRHVDRIRQKKPVVSARRLMQDGVKPGPRLGRLLLDAEEIAIEENCHDTEFVVEILKRRESGT